MQHYRIVLFRLRVGYFRIRQIVVSFLNEIDVEVLPVRNICHILNMCSWFFIESSVF